MGQLTTCWRGWHSRYGNSPCYSLHVVSNIDSVIYFELFQTCFIKNFVCVKYSFFQCNKLEYIFPAGNWFICCVFRLWLRTMIVGVVGHSGLDNWKLVTDCGNYRIKLVVESIAEWVLVIFLSYWNVDSIQNPLVKSAFSNTLGTPCSCCLCLAFSVWLQSVCWYIEQKFWWAGQAQNQTHNKL